MDYLIADSQDESCTILYKSIYKQVPTNKHFKWIKLKCHLILNLYIGQLSQNWLLTQNIPEGFIHHQLDNNVNHCRIVNLKLELNC